MIEVGLVLSRIDHRVVGCTWSVMEWSQAKTWRGEEVLMPLSCCGRWEAIVRGRVLMVRLWDISRLVERSLLLVRIVACLRKELRREDILLTPLLNWLSGTLVICTARRRV